MSHFDDSGPSTSKKAKYSDDIGSGTETIDLPACPYGERCYLSNAAHLKEYYHPKPCDKNVPTTRTIESEKLPVCVHGAKCYRKNLLHFAEFSHPNCADDSDTERLDDSDTERQNDSDTERLDDSDTVQQDDSDTERLDDSDTVRLDDSDTERLDDSDTERLDDSDTERLDDSDTERLDDSGSDTDVYNEDTSDTDQEEDVPNKCLVVRPTVSRGLSLTKSYSEMTEQERRQLIQTAFIAKRQLEQQLQDTKLQVDDREKQLKQLQKQVENGMLLMEGETEAQNGHEVKYFDLVAERSYKEGSAAQAHFRLAESQFYRLLAGTQAGLFKVKKVQYVINPQLVRNFKTSKESLKKSRGEHYSYPVLAFHGTNVKNITPICDGGFKIPGDVGFTHTNDNGYYGCGVYFSEYPSYSIGYIQDCTKLLLCQVLLGKTYQCTNLLHGEPCMRGYDSHVSPDKKELIIFSSAHILPSYVVHYTNTGGEFKYMVTKVPFKKKRQTEIMQTYWKAVKAKKTDVFESLIFEFSGRLCDKHCNLHKLVEKHGAKENEQHGEGNTGFNLLVCTESCYTNEVVKVTTGLENGSNIVREDFIYDSILSGSVRDIEEYWIGAGIG